MPALWRIVVLLEAVFNLFGGLFMAIRPLDALKPLVQASIANDPSNASLLNFGAELYRLFGLMVALQGMAFIRCRNSRSLVQLLQLAFIGDIAYLYLFFRFVTMYGDLNDIAVQGNFGLTSFFTILRLYTMVASWRHFRSDVKPKLA